MLGLKLIYVNKLGSWDAYHVIVLTVGVKYVQKNTSCEANKPSLNILIIYYII